MSKLMSKLTTKTNKLKHISLIINDHNTLFKCPKTNSFNVTFFFFVYLILYFNIKVTNLI